MQMGLYVWIGFVCVDRVCIFDLPYAENGAAVRGVFDLANIGKVTLF